MWLASTCPGCAAVGPAPCARCIAACHPLGEVAPPSGIDRAVALLAYGGVGADLVTALKYRNARRLLPWLGEALARAVSVVDAPLPEIVTWAPTVAAHRRQRGFDQAELLAAAAARALDRPTRRLLTRVSSTSQTGLDRSDRLAGPRFEARGGAGRVLVVDDVLTTGATVRAAAHALRWAGAEEVWVAVAAHRPWRTANGARDPDAQVAGGLQSDQQRSA